MLSCSITAMPVCGGRRRKSPARPAASLAPGTRHRRQGVGDRAYKPRPGWMR
jgi:hypothetical protein